MKAKELMIGDWVMELKYVHQLQQALRLKGIDKEIQLV